MSKHKNETKQERRIRRALRSYRCRTLKNFFIWLWGVISFVILAVAAGAIVLMAIPTKDLLGQDADKAGVIAEKNLLEAIMGINSYTFKDVPFAVDTINDLLETEIMEGKKVKDFVAIDTTGLDDVKLLDFPNVIGDRLQVVATIDNVVGLDSLGDIGKISVFSSWDEVTEPIDESAETFNPYLYYYKNSSNKYVRAYTNDKQKVAPVGATIYYAALGYIPVTEAVNVVADSFGRAKLTELLTNLGGADLSGENSLVGKLLGDKTVSQIGNITTSDIILYDILGGKPTDTIYKVLEGATGVSYDQISLDHLTGEDFVVNDITIASILGEDAGALGDVLGSAFKDKEFKDITIGDLTSEDFTLDNITIETFLGEDAGLLGDILGSAFKDKEFKDITIGDLTSEDFTLDNITIETFLGEDGGEIGEILSAALKDKPYSSITISDLTSTDFSIDNIYIKLFIDSSSEIATVISSALNKEDFELITIGDLSAKDPVTNEPLLNIDNVLLSSVMTDVKDTDTIAKILVAATPASDWASVNIGHLSNLTTDNIILSSVMADVKDTDSIAKMLVAATPATSWNEVNLGHLSNLTTNNITLSSVMTEIDADDTIAKMLVAATPAEDWASVNLGHLNNFVPGNITLSTVMTDINEDDTLAKIIVAATPATSWGTATVNNLSNFNTNNIPLTTVLPVQVKNEFGTVTTDNTKLYAILEKATKTTTANMTVGSLNSFNTDNILLSSVLDKSEAGQLVDVLEDLKEKNSYDSLTLLDIKNINLDAVRLSTIIGEINDTLKGILEDEYVDGVNITSYDDIRLSHLKSFSVDALHLYKVLPGDSIDVNLKNILMQITDNTNYNDIFIEDLHNEPDVLSKIKLSTVLGNAEVSNPILKQLIAKDVAVNKIDTAISSLSLYSVFGENAFTTDSTNATTTAKKYVKTLVGNKVTYTLDNNGTYYISKDAGVWLLLCFDATDLVNGSPNKYVESSLSVNDLTNGSSISTKISNATIRELKDVGIISESVSNLVDHLTLVDALNMIGG